MSDEDRCFFADWDVGPCEGRLIRAHLIKRQVLRREFPDRWRQLVDDPRSWVPCCGGPTGIGGHHGMLDHSRKLRIDWTELPLSFLFFCDELGLSWYAEREYGSRNEPGPLRRGRDSSGPGGDAVMRSADEH